MNVKSRSEVPPNSIVSKDFNIIHYCDSHSIVKQTSDSLDKIATDVFKSTKVEDFLMSIRNAAVKFVGLKGGDYKSTINLSDYYPVGSKAVYFTVIDRNENEIVMAENDKHLNFRVSIMTVRQGNEVTIYLSTLVKFNNLFGRLYFLPVQPFHRFICRASLNRLLKNR